MAKNVEEAANEVNNTLDKATGQKNIGNNFNAALDRSFKSYGEAAKGNTKGFENTLLRNGAGITGAAFGFNPGPDNVDNAISDAAEAVAKQNASTAAFRSAQALADVNNRVDMFGKTRAMSPGRAQTLLTQNYGQPSNTLLTISNKGA